MEKHSKQILGAILILAGLALTALGVKMLFGPNQYAATVRIRIEIKGDGDGQSLTHAVIEPAFDPYFIQITYEIIQSHLVLSNVVVSMNLNESWGKLSGVGAPLETTQSIAIIQKHLRLAPVKGTKHIAITYTSSDPNEAALIANAIAESYCKYREETGWKHTSGLKVLQRKLQEEEKQISVMQTNVEQLRQKFEIQNDTITNQLQEQQPYWQARKQLEAMLNHREILKQRVSIEEFETKIPIPKMAQIIDRAEPPKSPSSPNRILGAFEAALGLFLLCGGVLLLKPARD